MLSVISVIMKQTETLGVIIFLTISFNISAAKYKLDQEASYLNINGTSTLHDWSVIAKQINGALNAQIEKNEIKKLESGQIGIPVISLKSGKNAMDENMYNALKSGRFAEINYKLKNYSVKNPELTLTGDLTVAGVTNIIQSKVTYRVFNKQIIFNGKLSLKMSAYNIQPPELFLGTLKTHDEVTINYLFVFTEE